ncbi:TPA: CD3337/EF1877 family mobilome membrane protein [Enterococcus faecium]
MKRKISALFLFLGVAFQSLTVYASDISEIGKYDLELYGVRMAESSFLVKASTLWFSEKALEIYGSFVNFLLGISRVLWQGIDYLLQKALEFDVFSEIFGVFFKFGRQLFSELYSAYGVGLIALSVAYWGIKYLIGKREEAKKGLFRFSCALALGVAIFGLGGGTSKGEDLAKEVNTVFEEVTKSAFLVAGQTEELGNFNSETSLTDVVRNMYFEQSVVQPYLLMNYGTADIEKLEKVEIDPTEFLAKKLTKESVKEIDKKVNKAYKEYEKAEKNKTVDGTKAQYYAYLSQDKMFYKVIVALVAPFMVLAVGVPLMFVACGKLVVGFAMAFSVFGILFSSLLSLVPTFEGAIFGAVKKFLSFVFQKSVIVVLFLLIYYVGGFIDSFIPPETIFQFLMNAVVKIVVFVVIFAKRKIIFEKMKLGSVNQTMERSKTVRQNVSQTVRQAPSQMKEKIQQNQRKAQDIAIKGAEVAGNVYRPLKYGAQAAKMARTVQEKRQGKREGQVINPLEIGGRTPQSLGYSGYNVVYGGHTSGISPLAPKGKKSVPTLMSVNKKNNKAKTLLESFSSLPVDRLIPAIGMQKEKRLLGIEKPSRKHIGQTISFTQQSPIPLLKTNQPLSQQISQLKEIRLQAYRLSTNVPVRTSQTKTIGRENSSHMSQTHATLPNGLNEKQTRTNSYTKEKIVRDSQRVEQLKEPQVTVQTNSPKQAIQQRPTRASNKQSTKTKSIPPLPSGRTPQQRM